VLGVEHLKKEGNWKEKLKSELTTGKTRLHNFKELRRVVVRVTAVVEIIPQKCTTSKKLTSLQT
jgi:hypothetical protein